MIKEIPNTRFLVSLHHSYNQSANLAIFDISKKEKIQKVYSFEEVVGSESLFYVYDVINQLSLNKK